MARAKTTAKTTAKTKKTAGKAAKATGAPAAGASAPGAGLARATTAGASLQSEHEYTLAAAAKKLGPPDPAKEAAVRAAHPDDELQAEGATVASERILDDGPRLLSRALTHLESTDPDVQRAVRRAGLTRAFLALTADALVRLASTVSQRDLEQSKHSERKQVTTYSIEAATNHARSLKRDTLDRLKLVVRADPALKASLDSAAASADSAEQLAVQLTSLATVVKSLADHPDPTVRELAALKGIESSDADELTQAVEVLGQSSQAPANAARREEKQAVLDVLDGLCLVLLDDVLRALRTMARQTSKVHRPHLYSLARYFGAHGKDDEEPAPPPAPTPA